MSIIALVIITPYLYQLTKLNIDDYKNGEGVVFPWLFIILADLIPITVIITNISIMREKRIKQLIIKMIMPLLHAVIVLVYFIKLIV